ncbi:hypothetical protein [Carnobacterium maltaromaticum]|uniref:hypothetical protein n=1 Tax=Carnobacterium maltaromaticum TaxID=2751 RepID=UPI00026C8A86|nr:hypothetical protein [Carnobacterium maltaromaticum]
MTRNVQMNSGVLKGETIEEVRNEILQVLINNNLNYGETRIILEDLNNFLEEKAYFSKISS